MYACRSLVKFTVGAFVGVVSTFPRDGTPQQLWSFLTTELGGNLNKERKTTRVGTLVSTSHALCLAGSPMGQPSYLCSVLFARAPVLGLCFFVSVSRHLSVGH